MNPHPRSNIKLVISMEIITDIAILCQFLKTGLSSETIPTSVRIFFKCPHCNTIAKTEQGLNKHIQSKHAAECKS